LGVETLQFSGSLRVNALFLGALCPSKSGLMNKHIVKHIVKTSHKVNDALYPSESGLINKHTVKHTVKYIVKHIVKLKKPETRSCLDERASRGCFGSSPWTLVSNISCPSKSGLMNKHIVKHIVHRIWVSRPVVGLCRVNVSFLVPCARLPVSPD
jgi:hypothetical protein